MDIGPYGGGRAVVVVCGAIALPVVAESIRTDQTDRQAESPAIPIGGELCVRGQQVAALGARASIERDAADVRLRPFGEAHRDRPVVMPRSPEPVDRTVGNVWVEMIDPFVFWICRGLRRERCRQRDEEDG